MGRMRVYIIWRIPCCFAFIECLLVYIRRAHVVCEQVGEFYDWRWVCCFRLCCISILEVTMPDDGDAADEGVALYMDPGMNIRDRED